MNFLFYKYMKTSLLILAYNEDQKIESLILKFKDVFNEIIVVNDKSKDKTEEILSSLQKKYTNLIVINNSKNFGAGRSFELGVHKFLESDSLYLIKVDGDDQFQEKDILNIKSILEQNKYSFVRCDRFWSGGIIGKMPNIRYLGNSIASFFIKFSTGISNLNDPLNGLYGFKRDAISGFKLPKLFYKYGYPFYLSNFISYLGFTHNIKIAQIKNTITYGDEKSNLNPLIMLFKLTYFIINNFYSKIKVKLQYSPLQVSGLQDLISQLFLFSFFYSILRFFQIRYFESPGPQGNWFILIIIFFLLFSLLLVSSRRRLNKLSKNFFDEI